MKHGYLLVTDLDGTLLGDENALQAFRLRHESLSTQMRLVYASGRLIDDVRRLIAERGLCMPNAIIGGVGTQIEYFDGTRPKWCRPSPITWEATRICALLADLELQPGRFQTDYKVSYFLPNALPEALSALAQRLACAGMCADFVYSSHRDLDIVPRGVNKGSAVSFLATRWQIAARRVIVCGDSGNDLSLFQSRFRGVVVANCLPELRQLAGAHVYFATENHAAGVLQGVEHWLAQEGVAQ